VIVLNAQDTNSRHETPNKPSVVINRYRIMRRFEDQPIRAVKIDGELPFEIG